MDLECVGCRAFQVGLGLAERLLPWRLAETAEGPGAAERIPALLAAEGARRPLVVTGPHVARGPGRRVMEILEEAGVPYVLFDRTTPDPTTALAEEICARWRGEGCDSFLAVGGGSPMDAAKTAAALAARPGKGAGDLCGLLRVRRKTAPILAVPTTAGTGSETTLAAVVTDEKTHRKAAIMDPVLIPRRAVLDPELTLALPPEVTAASGMDALTHAAEAALCRVGNTRRTRAWEEEAVRLIFENLERAYACGTDTAARGAMLRAAYLAGAAFTRTGVGNVHAMAHAVGGQYGVAHGLANAVFLPLVMEDYGPAAHPALARLARAAGLEGESEAALARAFLARVRDMNRNMGIPAALPEIRTEDIPLLARLAHREANPLYPVPVVYSCARFEALFTRLRGL